MKLPFPNHCNATQACASLTTPLRIAFRDCDPMGVLWHGNYLAYCEQARHLLAEQLGFGVPDLRAQGRFAPVVRSQVMHREPLRAEEMASVEVALFPSRHPRLYHRYQLFTASGALSAIAETEQVLTDRELTMLLQIPPELAAVFARRPDEPAGL
ncbi:MAG: acyl-CoA thioesterase [Planctomycetota bacterium]|jgi:acyl-CoA thioester hydrolase|nr:acyl-CoA thioesterase [Planctomycetota bacterium]